jgi:hypothetical protein
LRKTIAFGKISQEWTTHVSTAKMQEKNHQSGRLVYLVIGDELGQTT